MKLLLEQKKNINWGRICRDRRDRPLTYIFARLLEWIQVVSKNEGAINPMNLL